MTQPTLPLLPLPADFHDLDGATLSTVVTGLDLPEVGQVRWFQDGDGNRCRGSISAVDPEWRLVTAEMELGTWVSGPETVHFEVGESVIVVRAVLIEGQADSMFVSPGDAEEAYTTTAHTTASRMTTCAR